MCASVPLISASLPPVIRSSPVCIVQLFPEGGTQNCLIKSMILSKTKSFCGARDLISSASAIKFRISWCIVSLCPDLTCLSRTSWASFDDISPAATLKIPSMMTVRSTM